MTTTKTHLNPTPSSLETQFYQPMLQESVHHFLLQLNAGFSDFSHFNSIFSRLIQTMPDPPLEVIWFYSAVNFLPHKNNCIALDDKLGLILALKELLQLLVSCSGSCGSSSKRVAVLAPLVLELCNVVFELKEQTGLGLDDVVIDREVDCLMDGLVSYISMCCYQRVDVDDKDDSTALSSCFVDLVKVWTASKQGTEFKFEDDIRLFFPIVSDGVRSRALVGGNVVGGVAGMVMCQVLLLSMCLKFRSKELPKVMEDDVLNSCLNIISGFRSCYFFDTLLKMMLETSLPVATLLNRFDEAVLRQVLFDAIILVDYPLFNPGCGLHLCSRHLNSLASVWLFVADKAFEIAGHSGDQTKIIMYTKAFFKSLVHAQLMRWVSNQMGMVEDSSKPSLSTPTAFIEWLVQLRSQATSGLDAEFSMLLERAIHHKLRMKCNPLSSEADGDNTIIDCCIYRQGRDRDCWELDMEMADSTTDAALISSCSPDFGPCRKRKGVKDDDIIQAKLLKYRIRDSPIKNVSPFQNETGFIRR